MAEADVVDQEDDHVRRALGRLDLETRRRLCVAGVELGFPWIVRLRDRQHRSIDRRGPVAGVAVCAGGAGGGALQAAAPKIPNKTTVVMRMAVMFLLACLRPAGGTPDRRAHAQSFCCFSPESGVNYSDEAGTPNGVASAVPVS